MQASKDTKRINDQLFLQQSINQPTFIDSTRTYNVCHNQLFVKLKMEKKTYLTIKLRASGLK